VVTMLAYINYDTIQRSAVSYESESFYIISTALAS